MAFNGNNRGFWSSRPWMVWIVGIAAAVLLLASFKPHGDAIPVRAVSAQRGTILSVVSTNGRVEPVQNFEAHAPVATRLRKLLVKEGDQVKKGQILALLDDVEARSAAARAIVQLRTSEADAHAIRSGGNQEEVLTVSSQLAKARADRELSQRNLDALRRLQQEGSASTGEVRDAQGQLERNDADLKLLERKQKDRYSTPEISRGEAQKVEAQSAYAAAEDVLSQLNIRAPFDGVVYLVPVRQGAFLNPGDLVLQEADLSKVLVRAFVDEPDVGRLAVGQAMQTTWDAIPDRIWNGNLSELPATLKLHGARNVGEATCVVSNGDYKLLPNVNVGVTIVVGEHRNALTVPREALRQDDRGAYLLQIVNHSLQRRDVQTSIINLTQAEISAGLGDGAMVALNSVNSKPIQNGSVVRILP